MSHAAFNAIMHNHSFDFKFNTTDFVENIRNYTTEFGEIIAYWSALIKIFLTDFLQQNAVKYTEIFGYEYFIYSLILLMIVICTGIKILESKDLAEFESNFNYLNEKNQHQNNVIDFLLDQNTKNQLKINNLIKQMKKLQKEVNEYA